MVIIIFKISHLTNQERANEQCTALVVCIVQSHWADSKQWLFPVPGINNEINAANLDGKYCKNQNAKRSFKSHYFKL